MTDTFSDEHRSGTVRLIRQVLLRCTTPEDKGPRKLRQSPESLAVLIFDELHARAREIEQLTLFPTTEMETSR